MLSVRQVIGKSGSRVSAHQASTAPAGGLGPRLADDLAAVADGAFGRLRQSVVGHDRVVWMALICLLAHGHLLIEDLPGVGKTTLARALAQLFGLEIRRLQCTADLLPADVTGSAVPASAGLTDFVFRPGPVFTNVLLADELNRASPKTQSALLEAMEEGAVTVDGAAHPLPKPFVVVATQNPHDSSGTYRLPHSLRDRFLMSITLGYPPRGVEAGLLQPQRSQPADVPPFGSPAQLLAFGTAAESAYIGDAVRDYVLDLISATRGHPDLAVGASPRAAIGLARVATVHAVAEGRRHVTPDDVKAVAVAALAHRVALTAAAELAGVTTELVLRDVTAGVRVPIRRR